MKKKFHTELRNQLTFSFSYQMLLKKANDIMKYHQLMNNLRRDLTFQN